VIIWGDSANGPISACESTTFHCFMFPTPAAKLMDSSLESLGAAHAGDVDMSVFLIANDNGLSTSCFNGAQAKIESTLGMELADTYTLMTAKTELAPEDVSGITSAIGQAQPDVVVICAHSPDTEYLLPLIKEAHTPDVIVGNNLAASEPWDGDSVCMLRASQWLETAPSTDAVFGWTSADFVSELETKGVTPDYYPQAAAAFAACAVISTATSSMPEADLAEAMAALGEIETVYGLIGFDSDGTSTRPMYVQQLPSDCLTAGATATTAATVAATTAATVAATTAATITAESCPQECCRSVRRKLLFGRMPEELDPCVEIRKSGCAC